jgi:hypothetical protein
MWSTSSIARAVIGLMASLALTQASRAASCQTAARHLMTLIQNNLSSVDQNTPGAGSDLLGTLSHKPYPGVVLATPRFRLKTYSPQVFTRDASHLPDSFSPSRELLKALEDTDGSLAVTGLPGTDIFAANSIGGTAHCNTTVFFAVSRRYTRMVQDPESWKNDISGSCGLTRSFASVDGVALVIDDSLDGGPNLASTLTLIPWGNGKWLDPCRVDFVFAPHFDSQNLENDWGSLNNWGPNDCGKAGCDGLRRAALNLVKQTQADGVGIENRLLATMTSAQQQEYARSKRATDSPDGADWPAGGDYSEEASTSAALTDTKPLLLPLVVDNRVFLARVGHFTIGWRVFSDWQVTVDTGEADKARQIAHFAIGMKQGSIIGATVK